MLKAPASRGRRNGSGLKLFNVYGPNERYHKGSQVSVVKVKYGEIVAGLAPRLFRSDQPGVADGEQKRDFVWIGDVVDAMLWLLDTPKVSGLFNLGTGVASGYLELTHALCAAAGVAPSVEFIDMPASLLGQYQYFTQADMTRLRAAGYQQPFTSRWRTASGSRSARLPLAVGPISLMFELRLFPSPTVFLQLGPLVDPLVRTGLYRRPGAGLAAGPLAGAASAGGRDHIAGG